MKKVHLIMPMGGAGSRFFKNGFIMPKPLIEINGYPFFYWATMSIYKYVDLQDLTFVVLQEHINDFQIDKKIKEYFPDCKIEVIPKILNGAVLTCLEGIKNIEDNNPVIFNDCDHSFYCEEFNDYCNNGDYETLDGALLTFESNDPKYSFLELDENENVIRTVEKKAISNKAICGAYYFRNKDMFKTYAEKYLDNCSYSEYFVSGVYNEMAKDKKIIKNFGVNEHLAFGTPDEYYQAENSEQFKRILK